MSNKSVQKYLVVGRYKADIGWLKDIPSDWQQIVVQKQTEYEPGDMPNVGREPAAFCHAILQHYAAIRPSDTWAFVQDHPFDHCPNFATLLNQPIRNFEWFASGELKTSDHTGNPYDLNLPVAELYEKWTGIEWQPGQHVDFAAGGQFMVTGKQLLRHSKKYYQVLYDDVCIDRNAWVAERLWAAIFDGTIKPISRKDAMFKNKSQEKPEDDTSKINTTENEMQVDEAAEDLRSANEAQFLADQVALKERNKLQSNTKDGEDSE